MEIAKGIIFFFSICTLLGMLFGILTILRAKHVYTHSPRERKICIAAHKMCMTIMLVFLFAAILAIEITIRLHGGLWHTGFLFWVHLPAGISALLLFLLARFKFTGLSAPEIHKKIAYWGVGLFLFSITTGIMLLKPA